MSLSTSPIVRVPHGGVNDSFGDTARGLVALVCAASAGIHAGLAPAHMAESRFLGVAFALDALVLGVAALVIRDRRFTAAGITAVAVALLATAVAYTLSRTTGLPVLHPETEPLDGLGMTTTSLEFAGVAVCVLLILRRERR